VNRWGNPGGAPFGRYPFGVRFEAESRFGGITIPTVLRAAWGENEFFRAEIRQARPEDFDLVQAMHEAMAPDNIYLRFFSYSRRSAEIEARRICRDPDPGTPGSASLLALRDGELVGMASYAGLIGHPGQADVAFAVPDHMHHKGIATLLLGHLVSLARSRQITTFTAEDAARAAAASGLPARRRPAQGHRARPEPGHRQATRGVRDGRADQGDALPAARPLLRRLLTTRPVRDKRTLVPADLIHITSVPGVGGEAGPNGLPASLEAPVQTLLWRDTLPPPPPRPPAHRCPASHRLSSQAGS
jgi:GNAT superfamily N-acetyltransferase